MCVILDLPHSNVKAMVKAGKVDKINKSILKKQIFAM